MNLKKQAVNGVKWTSISSMIVAILQILQVSILARLLSPSDFGLMAIVMVVIGFTRIFSDMGISNAIIHHQDTSHNQLSSLYWLNIASGGTMFVILVALSPIIANFYNQPELIRLLILLASSFIILAIGNQHRILFQKELNFKFIAKVEITSSVLSFIIAVTSALTGQGVYSLAYAMLTKALVSSICFLLFGLKIHKPSLTYKHSEIKKYINFGMFQMGDNSVNYFASQIDTVIIGRILGIESLGIYSISKQLVTRPLQIINPILTKVAFPTMAKIQNDQNKLKNLYLKLISILCTISFPLYGLLILFTPEIILLMLGEKWLVAVPIMRILALSVAIVVIGNPIGSLLLAKGKIHWGFYWNLILFFILSVSIYFASWHGLITIAWFIVILKSLSMIFAWYFLVYPLCKPKFIEYFSIILKPFMIVIISGISAYYFMGLCSNNILRIVLGSTIFSIIYSGISFTFNRDIILYSFNLLKKGR